MYSIFMESGFPSPAQGYEEKSLDLNRMLVKRPSSTFLMEMTGRALESRGIFPGDWLVVDRARKPSDGSVVVAIRDGEYICRALVRDPGGKYRLEGDACPAVPVDEGVQIVAAVTYGIRRLT